MSSSSFDRRARATQLAEDLVAEFCGSWPEAQRRKLVEALVADVEADPLRDLPELFGVAAAEAERRFVWDLLTADSRDQELRP